MPDNPLSFTTVIARGLLAAITGAFVTFGLVLIVGGAPLRYAVIVGIASGLGASCGLVRYRGLRRR